MKKSTAPPSSARRLAITVRGVVQGVGFRPFIYNAARDRGLSGWVRNEADMVRIEIQGDPAAVDAFLDAIRHGPPPQSRIDSIECEDVAAQQPGQFEIVLSEGNSAPRPTIPADLATCDDCLAEIRDSSQRRYRYPFTNCTRCGPRWSIIEHLPYDRPRTSMAGFAMCPDCQAEYDNPADRRFHAQPIACPRCGPTLRLLDPTGREMAAAQAALDATIDGLLAGQIVALKGLGGFQLLVDATNSEAVARLRERKRRPDRPFALMLPTLDDIRRSCRVSDAEARQLSSHQAPIVLLRRLVQDAACCETASDPLTPRPSPLVPLPSPLSPLLSPLNPYLGVMLPYTPLHHLIMAAVGRPLVCTSGNLSEEPMAIETDDALERLGPIVDVLLTHDRPIVRPVDDSIVRIGPAGPQVFRRARGFAPLPIAIHTDVSSPESILAVGGHLKNTVALLLGNENSVVAPNQQLVMSAHVGDLDSVLSVDVFRRAIDDLVAFFQTTPSLIVCDLHPDYASTRHAEELSARWSVPLLRVQHHHAHVAACMAEHGLRGPVLGLSWDGTGYGPDHTIWGGEALVCEGAEYRRVAHLRTFALPGGDRAAREPRRSAAGVLFEIFGQHAAKYIEQWFTPNEAETLLSMLARTVNSPRTSSMGRLFDAVAALCGLPPVITFEGQAAMALEFAADESSRSRLPGGTCGLSSTDTSIPAQNEPEAYHLPLVPLLRRNSAGSGSLPDTACKQPEAHLAATDTPDAPQLRSDAVQKLPASTKHEESQMQGRLRPFSAAGGSGPAFTPGGLAGATPVVRPVYGPPDASNSRTPSPGSSDQAVAPDAHDAASCPLIADWEPLVRAVLADRDAGVPVPRISARFHNALARMALEIAQSTPDRLPVVLTGGCFQNALLTARVTASLSGAGFHVYTHTSVPPGDGAIALGQAAIAASGEWPVVSGQ